MPRTYTEIFEDVRDFMQLDDVSLPTRSLMVALRRLGRMLTNEKIPLMKNIHEYTAEQLREGIDLSHIDHVIKIENANGENIIIYSGQFRDVAVYPEETDTYVRFIGNRLIGNRVVDGATYRVHTYDVYNPMNYNSDDGASDPILQIHPALIEAGIILDVLKQQYRPENELVIAKTDYDVALYNARLQRYTLRNTTGIAGLY